MFFWNLKSDLSQQSKILFLFLWKFLVYCFRFWVSHQSFTSSSMFTSQGARAFFQNWGTSWIMLNSSMAENMAVTHVVTQTWSVITRVVHIILLNIPIYKLPFSTVRIARFIRSVKEDYIDHNLWQILLSFTKGATAKATSFPGSSRRKGENPGNAVVAITRTIPRDWNPASRNNVQTNWSHQSPSDQSLSNCHGKLDKHFTPKLYVCWILHGIKWLCSETFLSTFFSLLFLASSFPQLQVGVWFVDQSLAAQNYVCCLRLRLETVGSLIYQKTKELICFRVESLFFNCSRR